MLSTPPAQVWSCSGDLVRSALSIGLHRDPEELHGSDLSELQIEIRRCVWYTIMEFEVQTSISCCMPSLIQTIEHTVQYPTETNDGILAMGIKSTDGDKANTTSQIALASSLPCRLSALRLLTQIQPHMNEVEDMLQELEEHRSALESRFRNLENRSGPQVVLETSMLDMCVRRPMISLYILQLQLHPRIQSNDIDIVRTARNFVDVALGVLLHSETLDPDLTEYETISNETSWTIFQAFHGDDLLRAASGACLAVRVVVSKLCDATSPGLASSIPQLPKTGIRRTVEETTKTLIKRTPELRSILKQIMGLAIVTELVRQDSSAVNAEKRMRAGLQRVFELCRERYASEGKEATILQDRTGSFIASTRDLDELFTSQELGIDPFGFDWSFDSLPSINF